MAYLEEGVTVDTSCCIWYTQKSACFYEILCRIAFLYMLYARVCWSCETKTWCMSWYLQKWSCFTYVCPEVILFPARTVLSVDCLCGKAGMWATACCAFLLYLIVFQCFLSRFNSTSDLRCFRWKNQWSLLLTTKFGLIPMLIGLIIVLGLVIQTYITQTDCSLNCLLGDLAMKCV